MDLLIDEDAKRGGAVAGELSAVQIFFAQGGRSGGGGVGGGGLGSDLRFSHSRFHSPCQISQYRVAISMHLVKTLLDSVARANHFPRRNAKPAQRVIRKTIIFAN